MAKDYSLEQLLGKTENEGTTASGKLGADEWNSLVKHVLTNKDAIDNMVSIKGIKYNGVQTFDKIDKDGYLEMTVGDSSGYNLSVEVTEQPDSYIAKGAYCPISLYVLNKQVVGESSIPSPIPCIVKFYLNDSSTPFYTENNLYDVDSTDPKALKQLTIDLSKISGLQYKSNEEVNTIKVEVNNQAGTVKTVFCTFRIVEFSLKVDNFKNVYTSLGENTKPVLRATVLGANSNVTISVDNKVLTTREVNAGESTNFSDDVFNSVNIHGVHKLEIFASVTREINSETGETKTIYSPTQTFNYIYGTTDTTPLVMSVIKDSEPEEYNNFQMSYVAYKYNDATISTKENITISICKAIENSGNVTAGDVLITSNQEVEFDAVTKSTEGSVTLSLFPVNNESLIGKKVVLLTIGNSTHTSEITIKESNVILTQLGGYEVYLTANNRSNNEPLDTLKKWISTGSDINGNTVITEVNFENEDSNKNAEFINTGSGWIADKDGNMAMHLKKGKYFTLNYKPFITNPTFDDGTNSGTNFGKTISIEFATRNCLNQKSPVITCMDNSTGTERGFEITASNAVLKSNTFTLNANFKEETRIKIDFVIEGSKTEYKYDTVSKDANSDEQTEYEGTSFESLAIIYVDGVYQGLVNMGDGTSFKQGNEINSIEALPIVFGSEDCDLDIYNIRIYNQALTPAQIINNYAYDTPKFNDKIAIAKRNDIFDSTDFGNKPNINIVKLKAARPELPLFIVKQAETEEGSKIDVTLPQNKSDWQTIPFTEWQNPMNLSDKSEAAVSWTTEFGRWRNQGTSSMSYPWPWRNWDWQAKFDTDKGQYGFKLKDGSTINKWAQYKGMERAGSIKKITLKKDYASSEMCNNAITSEYFTDMALAIGKDDNFIDVLSPAQKDAGAETTPYRLTFVATPCFLLQQFNDSTKKGSAGEGYEALGMMNLIPNKNECDYLGFTGEYVWDPNNNRRAQSWELADNMDEWFWYKKLNGITVNSDGTYTNDLASCYEARYPKDSTLNKGNGWGEKEESDFGMVVKDKATITEIQKAALYEEQKDIIAFHNWLVDVNRQIPLDYYAEHNKYRELSPDERDIAWNMKDGVAIHTYDTPEFRLAKFTAEAPTRLIIDQFCLYYIWREQFWAFDSGFKNLQVYTMGKANNNLSYMQWGCMVRDADTTLGIENTGKDIFPAHLEDTDYYSLDENGNIVFKYNEANNIYHKASLGSDNHAVLNGQFGSLWVNLRDAFGPRIAEIYRKLASSSKANWSSSSAISRFRKHQEKWCESLYNFGMRQYFGGSPFTTWITSGLGDKKNSRASWLDRGFYYRRSKYKCLNGDNEYCAGRIVCYKTPDVPEGTTENIPLKFKSYIPMYLGIKAHEQDMTKCETTIRITDIENTFDVLPGSNGLDFSKNEGDDTVTWFFGTDQLTELGDLARCCKVKKWQSINLPKLRELNLGHEKDRTMVNGIPCVKGTEYKEYISIVTPGENNTDNTNGSTEVTTEERPFTNQYLDKMNCSSLKQLTILDITNHTKLDELTDFENCTQLQELYAKGTDSLKTINLPQTTSLKVIYLGKSLVRLNLIDLTGIEKFELEGGSNIEYLNITNCGSVMASQSYSIMKTAINSLKNAFNSGSKNVCILKNINWTAVEVSYLESLLDINAELSGKITIKNTSDNKLTNDLKVRLVNKYGDIDNPDNSLYITYEQYAITDVKLPSKVYIYTEGEHQLTFIATPNYANTYKSAEWSLSSNEYATINSKTGVITRNNTQAENNVAAATLTLTIKQLPEKNGKQREDIVKTCEVYFYERIAQVGDIVFNDGTYSNELDDSKTPIGMCFYVDPNNKENRLMCALNTISSINNITLFWGTSKGTTISTGYYGTSPNLNKEEYWGNTNFNCYNIKELSNINNSGVNITDSGNLFSDGIYIDNTTNDFNKFDFGTAPYIGWITTDSEDFYNITIDNLQLPNNNTELKISIGDKVPLGYYNTLAIIQHRNKLLDKFNDGTKFNRPTNTVNQSEFNRLINLLSTADEWNYADRIYNENTSGPYGTYGSTLYFPAASLCFAYEPNSSNLIDKFKKYNWFLPTAGELTRAMYYIYHAYKIKNNNSISNFNNSNLLVETIKLLEENNKLSLSNFISSSTKNYWTSSEINDNHVYVLSINANTDNNIYINKINGYNHNEKSTTPYNVILPICRF